MLTLRRARASDLAYIHRLEHDPKNAPFINPWTRGQHQAATKDRDCLHLVAEADGRRVGFVFLRGLKDRAGIVEFKRIVIDSKGEGHGRAAVRGIQDLAFGKLKARRLWLNVKGFNDRARKLYASEGFVKEGELRECFLHRGRSYPLLIMGMLRREYRRARR